VRHYSLTSDPADLSYYEIAVLKDAASRGASQYLHRTSEPGTRIEVSGPINAFQLVEADHTILIAGGSRSLS
jgi:ferredoxin-NADP reductase